MPVNRRAADAPTMVFRVPRSSTVDLIAIELRNAILTGALPVGSPIGEIDISTQLGVSRSPLREATQRLVQEGLLTATPGRGLRVSRIGPEHVKDVYDARMAIESQAIRLIVANGDAGPDSPVVGSIDEAYRALVAASDGPDARAIGDADLDFHRHLVESSGSRRLTQAMTTLAIETRIASLSSPDGYAVRRSVSPTYAQLIAALRAGDADAAVTALGIQLDEAVARLRGDEAATGAIDTVQTDPDETPRAFSPISVPGA